MKTIWVTFQKEGIHMYPGADTDPKLATGGWDDVSFLGVPHRHIFHFKVWIEVFHDDRDIEFIQFKTITSRNYLRLESLNRTARKDSLSEILLKDGLMQLRS